MPMHCEQNPAEEMSLFLKEVKKAPVLLIGALWWALRWEPMQDKNNLQNPNWFVCPLLLIPHWKRSAAAGGLWLEAALRLPCFLSAVIWWAPCVSWQRTLRNCVDLLHLKCIIFILPLLFSVDDYLFSCNLVNLSVLRRQSFVLGKDCE